MGDGADGHLVQLQLAIAGAIAFIQLVGGAAGGRVCGVRTGYSVRAWGARVRACIRCFPEADTRELPADCREQNPPDKKIRMRIDRAAFH